MKLKFSKEQEEEIKKKYETKGIRTIAKEFGVGRGPIKRILLEQNLFIPHRKGIQRKYSLNESYFERIDSKEKAYILGFIAADGCVSKKRGNSGRTLSINIKPEDYNVLDFIKKELGSDKEIKKIKGAGFGLGTSLISLEVNSTKMCSDLEKLGIVARKSLILKPPKIEEEYFMPFIKGYFDGDGTIYKTKCYNNYCVGFCGTKEMLEWISNILKMSIKLEKRHKDCKNNYYFRFGGTNKPYSFMTKFYDSVEISINRKRKLYNELKVVCGSDSTNY